MRFDEVKRPAWERFVDGAVLEVFAPGGLVVDIGGGLRIAQGRGNRFDSSRKQRFGHLAERGDVDYVVTDVSDRYRPDRVEDIHALSFDADSVDGIFCLAVLEHVPDPKRGAHELMRVLRPGGHGLVYVPFLYPYHARSAEYGDFQRFTPDALEYLFGDATRVTIEPVRGMIETILYLVPRLGALSVVVTLARLFDILVSNRRAANRYHASGYYVLFQK